MLNKRVRLQVERLEERDTPASITLGAGILSLVGDNTANKMVVNYVDVAHTQVRAVLYSDFGGVNETKQVKFFKASDVNRVVMIGGNQNDLLINNTEKYNVLMGGNGEDKLVGGDGGGVLLGGNGKDFLVGGAGVDAMEGGDGNDQVFGKDNNDVLLGGNGVDCLYGGHGDDLLFGGNGPDVLFGSCGDDWLDGGLGKDYIHPGTGNNFWLPSSLDVLFLGLEGKPCEEQPLGDGCSCKL